MKLSTVTLIFWAISISRVKGYNVRAQNKTKRSITNPSGIKIESVAFTSKWMDADYTQILEVTVTNTDGAVWLYEEDNFIITADSGGVHTIVPGKLKRLQSGDTAVVQVGVQNDDWLRRGAQCAIKVTATWGGGRTSSEIADGICGIGPYNPSQYSVSWHTSPQWYDDAKFGIFIHWGIYSVPAYGGQGGSEQYAEWYWNYMHNPNAKSGTYNYHKDTYGTNIGYDDFIDGFPASGGYSGAPGFTGSHFNAQEWVDLIAAAGARYMVPVAKHHDGFALFNFPKDISQRSSVYLGPKRDFLGELLDAAAQHQPQIHRGTYFSMPEWYNPAYPPNAVPDFPGGPPTNPYTGETLSYSGFVATQDFVNDVQFKQMQVLANNYNTELMWCDMGGPSNSLQFLSDWYNSAYSQGRQVAVNNRCGLDSGDFDTPEYNSVSGSQARKWESNRGMDPLSFGYNFQTPDSAYLTAEQIVYSLVDTVSRNGNFLLNIGPMADGTIRDVMKNNLAAAGKWIIERGESIFGTRYWQRSWGFDSDNMPDLRFTTTNDAFYIHAIGLSGFSGIGDYVINFNGQLPYDGDRDGVTVVGGSMDGTAVTLSSNNGAYSLHVPAGVANADSYGWTFKITYK